MVIEAKTASRSKPDWREGAKQLGMYAEEIDQLFYTNAYGVGVNETKMMYGVPGRRLQFWLQWRDPWPHEVDEYDEMKVSLYGPVRPQQPAGFHPPLHRLHHQG